MQGGGERMSGADRDLVLAPGEYAYLQGETSGRVGVGVGPCTINQTGQDRPVGFDQDQGRFRTCGLTESVRMCPIAAEGEYIVLKNPSNNENESHPKFNESDRQNSPTLKMGSKINIPGPITFALWPGQISTVIPGHRLRSNQYLLIRIYNEEEAQANWDQAVFKPANAGETTAQQTENDADEETTTIDASTTADDLNLTIGKLFVIKGTDSSFYIPPTGVEVVPEGGNYVRDAVTLERLEHTILVDENGDKRFCRGPAVVFPEPTETFVEQGKNRKAKAIELHKTQGIHVKVIEDYTDGEDEYTEGEEVFITGGINALYFPRKEHSIIQFGPDPKHYALQIPKGEGRYLLNRESGNVETVVGPRMLLPDPREELVVRRVLSQGQCRLMYPENEEVSEYNAELANMMETSNSGRSGLVSERDFAHKTEGYSGHTSSQGLGAISDDLENAGRRTRKGEGSGSRGGAAGRRQARKGPKSVVVGSKFDNVPSIDLWTGYAVKVVSKTGERRVELGPKTILLDYDENLEVLELSMGKPKNTDNLMPTVYLRVSNNKVSDILTVETSDNIEVTIKLAYRVNFDVELKDHWFDVENYVKLLCDHTRSILKSVAKQNTIQEFYTNGMSIVRDTILHKVKNPEDPKLKRLAKQAEDGTDDETDLTGLYFSENGMRVTDVEVLDLQLNDERIAQILDEARKNVVVQNISLENSKRDLELTEENERINKAKLTARQDTVRFQAEIEQETTGLELGNSLALLKSELDQVSARKEIVEATQANEQVDHEAELARAKDKEDATLAVRESSEELKQRSSKFAEELRQSGVTIDSEALIAQFASLQGGFTEALAALSRDDVAVKIAEATSVQSMIGGKSAVDVIAQILGNSPRLEPFLGALTRGAERTQRTNS